MNTKGPKNDGKYEWTEHSKFKMAYYGLSPQRILRVIRAPYRTETGIVENTIAVMQPASTRGVIRLSTRGGPGGNVKKGSLKSKWGRPAFGDGESEVSADGKNWSSEIWVMYQLRDSGADSKIQETNSKQIPNHKLSKAKIIQDLKNKLSGSANRKIRIISAWRYPGVTDENDPIPAEILREIENII